MVDCRINGNHNNNNHHHWLNGDREEGKKTCTRWLALVQRVFVFFCFSVKFPQSLLDFLPLFPFVEIDIIIINEIGIEHQICIHPSRHTSSQIQ